MNALVNKLGVGFCIGLILFLSFFIYKTKKLENALEQKNEKIIALDFSEKAGETTLQAVLENAKNNYELIKELEKERSLLKAQSQKQRKKLEEFIKYDEESYKWATQDVPNNILSLLLDSRP